MSFTKEFREFAVRGNVMDLAIGVIIGAAFGKIVESVVGDIIMPVIGLFFKADFTNVYLPLSDKITPGMTLAQARAAGPVLAWGNFVTVVLNFVILAFVIFMMVKGLNSLRREKAAAEAEPAKPAKPTPSVSEKLLEEIRDALAGKTPA